MAACSGPLGLRRDARSAAPELLLVDVGHRAEKRRAVTGVGRAVHDGEPARLQAGEQRAGYALVSARAERKRGRERRELRRGRGAGYGPDTPDVFPGQKKRRIRDSNS